MDLNRRNLFAAGLAVGVTAATGSTAQTPAPAASSGKPVKTIPLEEACLPKDVFDAWGWNGVVPKGDPTYAAALADVHKRLQDFDGQRLEEMDRNGIDMAVLSLTVPGPQAEPDATRAQDMAQRGNDALAKAIANHPKRYAAFGCLSMHDPDAACREFERAVKHLGMCGVLLNNFQRTGSDGNTVLFYDDPRYDGFWEMAEKLEAPVYLHPNVVPPSDPRAMDLAGVAWLKDAAWTFAATTGFHALRIITTGVFDRHPKAQLILGHNGEHIVPDLWRIDNRIHRETLGYKAKNTVRSYFRTNVQITTSGEFSDNALQNMINEIGADRVLFSIDYPYEDNAAGASWFAKAPISDDQRVAIGRGNAIKLLKLPLSS